MNNSTMRVDDELRAALAIITGEAQAEAASSRVNTTIALKDFIRLHRPDIMEHAINKTNEDKQDTEQEE